MLGDLMNLSRRLLHKLMEKGKMKTDDEIIVAAKMSREMADALERMAREQLTSRSTVVRQLITRAVAEHDRLVPAE
jgi:Ribbon-helix-helix protein, copG family